MFRMFILGILFLTSAFAQAADIKMFHIDRSKNKNQVYYLAVVDQNCQFVTKDPIKGQWLVLEKGPDVIEELSTFDMLAYGVKNVEQVKGEVTFNLKALESKKIKVSLNPQGEKKCLPLAQVQIKDKWAKLERIYVFSEEGLILPEVKYVDIFGKLDDGSAVSERIIP